MWNFFFSIFSETKKRRKDPSESTTEEDNGAPDCKGKHLKKKTYLQNETEDKIEI